MCRYFLESNFVAVKRLFALIYSNQDNNDEIFKARRYFLLEGIIKNYNVNINRENFHDQPIDSDIN